MQMWEVALWIIMIVDLIICFRLHLYIHKRFNFKDELERIDYIAFTVILCWFGYMPTYIILSFFGTTLGVFEWIAYCWVDFWTMEVDLIYIGQSLLVFFIPTIIYYIGIKVRKKWFRKVLCPDCNAKVRQGKYCQSCGGKLDA